MNDSVYKISLDINEHGSQAVLKAKMSDTGRKIYISLRAGGTPYKIEDECYAFFSATKPDGSILYNSCAIDNSEIIYEFTEQTCSVVGRTRCEIKLYGKDDKLITSPRFALLVDGTVYPDGRVESQDEFSALTQMVSDILTAQALAREATESANTSAENATKATENTIAATTSANQATEEATQSAQNAITATESANEATGRAIDAMEAANIATNDANKAAESANEAATNVIRIAKNAMAVGNVAGVTISMDDAVELGFVGCRVFGKTTQNGTPTPDAPIDLVSVGDSGSITVNVTGKNQTQSMTVATPNGLPGIPVTSGGNYTDANGQQWICDEVDFARGLYIQRLYRYSVTGDENITRYESADITAYGNIRIEINYLSLPAPKENSEKTAGLCSHFVYRVKNQIAGSFWANKNTGLNTCQFRFIESLTRFPTLSDFVSFAKAQNANGTPIVILYELEEPEEVPLTKEELTAYAAIHTYRNNTTVSNDAGAYMELEYVMDAKKYIDSLVISGGASARLSNVTIQASAWKTEADGLHSQVVSIAGVTEYSKVDLLPSVEQLAIFHNKDVAFVTENEDGVVTVYAIGDKPTQDYTMQVQITEVAV